MLFETSVGTYIYTKLSRSKTPQVKPKVGFMNDEWKTGKNQTHEGTRGERGHELKNQSFKKSTFVLTASSSIFFMSRFYWIYSFELMSFKSCPEGENMDWCSLLDHAPSRNHVLGNHITGRGYWFQNSNGFLDWHWILKPLRKLDVLFRILKLA